MTLALCCISHSPLVGLHDPADTTDVRGAIEQAAAFVRDFDPQLAVIVAPDHLNGFVYGVMPQFCVGTAARAIGDWATRAGDLDVDGDVAEAMAAALLDDEVDVALSARMRVDHGFAQPLELLTGGLDHLTVVPVFVNCAAPPLAPMTRSHRLGDAMGRFLANLDRRVLVVASGGLSHDPPLPSLRADDPNVRERVIVGIPNDTVRRDREQTVINVAGDFAAGRSTGMRALTEDFDRDFLAAAASADVDRMVAMAHGPAADAAGGGFQEVRTWIAAVAASRAAGRLSVRTRFYRAIPEWIAGFAVLTAGP